MTIIEERVYQPLAHEDDPDDFRPDSELAIVVDPSDGDGRFCERLAVFYERVAEGDRIPLHQHTVEEVLFVDEGQIEARVGDTQRVVGPGTAVFVPARTPHGFENIGEGVARIHAVFPTTEITIKYLERNPAPGTEGDPPGPPLAFDVRELVEGDLERAVRPVDEELFGSKWRAIAWRVISSSPLARPQVEGLLAAGPGLLGRNTLCLRSAAWRILSW